jgi:hypothetical protein
MEAIVRPSRLPIELPGGRTAQAITRAEDHVVDDTAEVDHWIATGTGPISALNFRVLVRPAWVLPEVPRDGD